MQCFAWRHVVENLNVTVDETQTAALRGHSIDTQRRHRRAGIGPKAFRAGSKGWRYWLRDIVAEQEAHSAKAVGAK
jgi:hypothetical protein